MPYSNVAYYGLSLALGGAEFPLAPDDSFWVQRKSPTQRQDDLLADTGHDHSAEIALLEYEKMEWAAAYYSDHNYWNDHFTSWYKNYATIERRQKSKLTWAVSGGGIHFEPFDPWDTDNYKVTSGDTYGSTEVEAPKIPKDGEVGLVIGLAPRLWDWNLNYNAWHYSPHFDATPDILFKRSRSKSGSCWATTSPAVRTFGGLTNRLLLVDSQLPGGIYGPAVTHGPTHNTTVGFDGSPSAYDHIVLMLDRRINSLGEGSGLSIAASEDISWQSSQTPWTNYLLERTDAAISVHTAVSDVGRLAGAFQYGGSPFSYYVWRRTPRSGGDLVLSSGLDSTNNFTSGEPSITGSYITKEFNSYGRSFAYFDPSNLYDHQVV